MLGGVGFSRGGVRGKGNVKSIFNFVCFLLRREGGRITENASFLSQKWEPTLCLFLGGVRKSYHFNGTCSNHGIIVPQKRMRYDDGWSCCINIRQCNLPR